MCIGTVTTVSEWVTPSAFVSQVRFCFFFPSGYEISHEKVSETLNCAFDTSLLWSIRIPQCQSLALLSALLDGVGIRVP